MDKRIEELVKYTKERYGLNDYYLHTFDIYRSTTVLRDTVYSLSMEWFPNYIKNWDDETTNPDGTACIEIDIHSKKVKQIIFSKGISVFEGMRFDIKNKDEIIKWMENETGLNYGRQFDIWKEEERGLHFKACIDGAKVSPSGHIDFKLDKEGRLTLFSVYGQFPTEEQITKENFTLNLEQIELLAKEQLKLVEFPIIKQNKLVPAFAIEEIYIKNNGLSTIPFAEDQFSLKIDKVIEWDDYNKEVFQRKAISYTEHVTADQAFQCEPHPELLPIIEKEIEKCVSNMKIFFSQEYTNDSGKWALKSLYRDKGYIHATVEAKEQKERAFKRKIKLFIDSETYQVINYMDNHIFLQEYMNLKEAEEVKVNKEEAFNKLKHLFELTPYYVYDIDQGKYVLCGKLDCQYAVKANNGEVVELNEL